VRSICSGVDCARRIAGSPGGPRSDRCGSTSIYSADRQRLRSSWEDVGCESHAFRRRALRAARAWRRGVGDFAELIAAAAVAESVG